MEYNRKALAEVLQVLNNIDERYTSKISQEFIETIINNVDLSVEFKYDINKSFEEQDLSEEALAILAIIYLKYWATEEEKIELQNAIIENDKIEEIEKRKKYDPDNIFKKEKKLNNYENMALTVVENESILKKIIEKIKKIFSGQIKN